MQPEARNVHIRTVPAASSRARMSRNFSGMFRHNAPLIVVFVKTFQSLVAYRPDHRYLIRA